MPAATPKGNAEKFHGKEAGAVFNSARDVDREEFKLERQCAQPHCARSPRFPHRQPHCAPPMSTDRLHPRVMLVLPLPPIRAGRLSTSSMQMGTQSRRRSSAETLTVLGARREDRS